jgi:deazaflavin-dependent oxidoreductase (nitroreductase family)
MPTPVVVIAVIVAAAAVLGGGFVLGMRAKSPLVQGPIVWVSKRWLNRRQMRSAGTPGAYAGVVRHVGRVSGRAYETPVTIVAADDAFLVALPYGTGTQWLRNVLAAGSATIVTEGHTHEVDRPELVPMETVADAFPESDRKTFRLFKVDRALRLRRAESPAAAPDGAAPNDEATAAEVRAAGRPAAELLATA